MPDETTKTPSIIGALLSAFADSPDAKKMADSMASAITGIGGALLAAGVSGAAVPDMASLGLFSLDNNLPKMVAAASLGQDENQGRSVNT